MKKSNYKKRVSKKNTYLKKCFLPLYKEDGKKSCWVHYNGDNLSENRELYEAFSDIIKMNIDYHFEICLQYYDVESDSLKVEVKVCLVHNFNVVLESLYYYPESFNIPKKYVGDYTKNEMDFINRLKNYLLLIGLKDKKDSEKYIELMKKYDNDINNKTYYKAQTKLLIKEALDRVNNSLANKYQCYDYIYAPDEIIEAILNGKKKTRIYKQYENSEPRLGHKFFVLNEQNDYKIAIEIVKETLIPFRKLDEKNCDYKLNGFSSLEDYKKYLFKEFNEDGAFNEDDTISIATFKVIGKY